MSEITKKLINVQNFLKAPKKQFNSFGKYKYRSCEDILEAAKPLCISEKLLLTLSDEIICVGASNYVKATATVSDGVESISVSAIAREAVTKKGMDDSQITGTASSYSRKYALNGLFCIDDTNDSDTQNNNAIEQDKKDLDKLAEVNRKLGTKQKTWEDLLSWMESQPVIKNGKSTVTGGPLTEAVSAMRNKKSAEELCGFLIKYFTKEN